MIYKESVKRKKKHRGSFCFPLCFSCILTFAFLLYPYVCSFTISLRLLFSSSFIFVYLYLYICASLIYALILFPYISLISMRLIWGMRISGIVKGWSGFAAAAS